MTRQLWTRSRVALCLSSMILFATAGPAGATPSSSSPTELWGPAFGSPNPSEVVAGAGGGETAVAWHVSEDEGFKSTVFLSRHGEAGGWEAPDAVSQGDGAPQNGKEGLGVDGHGDVLLAWEGENAVGSDLYMDEVPNGQPARTAIDFWHDAGTVNGIDQVTVGFDAAGDATVMWRAGSGLYLARRPVGGLFGSPVRIAGSQETEVLEWPSFASGANGDAAVVGSQPYVGGVAAALVPHGSGARSLQVLQSQQGALGSARVAIAPDGETIAAWETTEYHEEGEFSWDGWLMVAVRPPGSDTFSAPRRIDSITNNQGLAIAVSPSGEATLVYNEVGKLVAVSRAAGGNWRPPERVGSIPATENPAAAYDSSGNLYVAWLRYAPGSEPATADNGYYAATRDAGGTFDGNAHRISRPIPNVASAPALAVDHAGAFAAWSLYDEGRVEAAGPFYAPWQEPAVAPSNPPSGVAAGTNASAPPPPAAPAAPAAKPSRPSALAQELATILDVVSTRLHHPKRDELSITSPGAGLLTIEARPPNHKGAPSARNSTVLLGRWVLRRSGRITIRVSPSHRIYALLAHSGAVLLTATFREHDGRSTTAQLRSAR